MKHLIKLTLKQVLADRPLLVLLMALFLGTIGYIAYVALSLSPTDLQLATRFTSFGETQFYRNKWYYLLSFIGFGVLFFVAHSGMTIKLFVSEMRQLAYAFGLFSLVILVLMFAYTSSVLGIAYL